MTILTAVLKLLSENTFNDVLPPTKDLPQGWRTEEQSSVVLIHLIRSSHLIEFLRERLISRCRTYLMEHYFELPVSVNGEERSFKGRLVTFGYVYKFHIVVDGQELIFEKDDEQEYRVLSEGNAKEKIIAPALIQAIVTALENLPNR